VTEGKTAVAIVWPSTLRLKVVVPAVLGAFDDAVEALLAANCDVP
jgi:hypothetical protein